MTDDELIQRAREAWDRLAWGDAKAAGIAAIPALFRAADERDELRARIREMRPYNGQFMSVQEHDEICDALHKRVAELERECASLLDDNAPEVGNWGDM
jgi:G:T/U-mismatch repair DNA glycosylase